jgi:hypothetical protein
MQLTRLSDSLRKFIASRILALDGKPFGQKRELQGQQPMCRREQGSAYGRLR